MCAHDHCKSTDTYQGRNKPKNAFHTKLWPNVIGYTRGQFHKTLRIRKLWICSYGQILTVNLLINWKNSVIYGEIAVNYGEKRFMEQAPGADVINKFYRSTATLHCNKALWLNVQSHVTSLNQSECFNWVMHSNATLKSIYDIAFGLGQKSVTILKVWIAVGYHLSILLCDWAFLLPSGASPIKILQRKFYTTLIFKHLDWLINLSSQSECLNNCIA